ncbi:MAG TPA: ABC transporter permease [Chitinispirillaceae bacterium]|jgi:putative ABC transport system permease protein|nr:ABC transporter permease [Chitinispirillaceae bacterium]
MNILEAFRLALNSINTHKLRSVLTTLGVMIGVMTVIGMLALIDGLNRTVSNQLASIGSNTLYVQKHGWVMNRDEAIRARRRRNLTLEDAKDIERRLEPAQRIASMLMSTVTVRFGNRELDGVQLIGTTPEYQYITEFNIASGRQMTESDMNQSRQNAMIGKTVAEELFPSREPVGKSILVGRHRFEVTAVLEEKGSLFGNDQDNAIVIPLTTFVKLFSGPITPRGGESVTIIVKPSSPEQIDDVKGDLTRILRQRRNLKPGEEDDFSINSAEQLMTTYRTITSGIFGLMIGVTALSLIVGGIGIMNIMLVSVAERTREIGIRKAVGARKRDIHSQFLIEAVSLSVTGGIIGTVLGFMVAWAVSRFINLPAAVTWWSVVLGFLFSASVGVFFGWYPARRAASLKPIEALRYE